MGKYDKTLFWPSVGYAWRHGRRGRTSPYVGSTSVPDPNPDLPDPHFFGLPDPYTSVRGMDPDPDPSPDQDPSIIKQK
jgi:hypothetical protein